MMSTPASAANRRAVTPVACALSEITKSFGSKQVLRGINLTVQVGEIVALLGRNGAGKTTSIDILLGLRPADSGRVEVLGGSPTSMTVRRRVGAAAQEPDFPSKLTPREVLELVAAHYPNPTESIPLLERFGLGEMARKACGGLSGGQKRRLATACAVVGDPELAVLDEPSAALDVEGRESLWDTIRLAAEGGRGVLLTTHDMEEAEALADRVVVIHDGLTTAEGTIAQLCASSRLRRLVVTVDELPELPAGAVARRVDSVHIVVTDDVEAVRRALHAHGVDEGRITITVPSLRETFLELTGGSS